MPTALVIDGHPNPDSLTSAIARSYADGHGDARLLALRDLDFDPHMRFGYRKRIPIEADLQDARDALHAAERIVIATPMWWASVPALLKGFFDRALLPQQEYRMSPVGLPQGLLTGRRGRMYLLADTPRIALPFVGTPAARQVSRHTMRYCGVRPFPVRRMLGVGAASERQRERWIAEAARTGASDRRRDDLRSGRSAAAEPIATTPAAAGSPR
ncbi:NAD(P)H-dependent oxidoreductase [Leucobacter iarius]|uniref:NAD(P)H-dependent oxidoreductase n=1 Tax=Leucobacter iarius TaxID=333963 RepID=A0ABN2L6G1_9MICO